MAAVHGRADAPITEERARGLIDRTWELSLDLLEDWGLPQTRTMLRLLSLLADAPIPYQLLDAPVMAASGLFPQLDTARLRGLLDALSGVGLLDLRDPDPAGVTAALPATFRIHPLIRDTSRHNLDGSGQEAAFLALATKLIYRHATSADVAGSREPAARPFWRILTPHTLSVFNRVCDTDQSKDMVLSAATAAYRCAGYLAAAILHAEARAGYGAVLRAYQRHLPGDHPYVLATKVRLANLTGDAGDPATARDQCGQLLPLIERSLDPQHHDVLSLRASLAQWTGMAGNATAARDQWAELVSLTEAAGGPEHRDCLDARVQHAKWAGVAGDDAGARDELAEVVSVLERTLGADDYRTLWAQVRLARSTGITGQVVEARDQLRRLVPGFERVYGTTDVHTLELRADLARWTANAGDAVGARDSLAALVPHLERILGTAHPQTLAYRVDLARWTGAAGDAIAARDALADLIPRLQRRLGAEHPDTLLARHSLAHWTGAAGDAGPWKRLLRWPASLSPQRHRHGTTAAAAARDQFTELVPFFERIFSVDHPDTLAVKTAHEYWVARTNAASGG